MPPLSIDKTKRKSRDIVVAMTYYSPFKGITLHTGKLFDRPNRFVVRCELGRSLVSCHLPNPGRLWELLPPNSELILTKNEKGKTDFTVVAVRTSYGPILLHTHKTNDLVHALLERQAIPSLEGYAMVRREVQHGDSRFDFLLRGQDGAPFFLEVKSCTLFGKEGAMFPDAPSSRATKHVSELGRMSNNGISCGVLFVVHSDRPRWFCPEYHTDPDFAQTIAAKRDQLKVLALTVRWEDDMMVLKKPKEIPLNWELLNREFRDIGGCIALFSLKKTISLPLVDGKSVSLRSGYWALVSGASLSLKKILSRLTRKGRKGTCGWDLITREADVKAIPFRSSADLGEKLKIAISTVASEEVAFEPLEPKESEATLFRFDQNPMGMIQFTDIIVRIRIDEPSLAM